MRRPRQYDVVHLATAVALCRGLITAQALPYPVSSGEVCYAKEQVHMAILTPTEPRPRPALERHHQPYEPRDRRQHFLRLDLNEDLSGPLTRVAIPRGPDLAMYPTTHDLVRDLAAA